ncbi:mesotocin receptor-like [Galendromus occidentalis]|uniref:Mesotocin receptor-like n=1 Tax=Galendromus occidentalis TaxID=34638 RepID=A0AAJ7WJ79_9ACAR|nr:mesotocin receptor-like [Galendromus occidentalis]
MEYRWKWNQFRRGFQSGSIITGMAATDDGVTAAITVSTTYTMSERITFHKDVADGDGGGRNNANNQSSDLVISAEPEQWVSNVKCGTLLSILIVTLCSNIFVLWVVFVRNRVREKQPLSRVQLFIVNLSLADILVALLNILPQLAWDLTGNFEGGIVLCKFVKYAQVFVLYLSTYILTGMSLDRLFSMRAIQAQWETKISSVTKSCRKRKLNRHQSQIGYRKLAKFIVVVAWVLSAVLALPQLLIFSYSRVDFGTTDNSSKFDCLADFSWHPRGVEIYVTSFVIIILGLPVTLMLSCYGYICYIIFRMQKRHPLSLATRSPQRVSDAGFLQSSQRMSLAKVRMVKMTFSVVLCFIVCWTPFCVAQLLMAYALPGSSHVSPLLMVFLLLASLNSAVNPWIYALFCIRGFSVSKAKAPLTVIRQVLERGERWLTMILCPEVISSDESDPIYGDPAVCLYSSSSCPERKSRSEDISVSV